MKTKIVAIATFALPFALTLGCATSNTKDDTATTPAVALDVDLPPLACAEITGPDTKRLGLIVDGAHRAAKNRARNSERHPVETLAFFGVRPDSHVLELWPGGGWYTEVLAPYTRDCGSLRVTNYDVAGPDTFYPKMARRLQAKFDGAAALYGKIQSVTVTPPAIPALADPDSLDFVLTFRNNHGWIRDGLQDAIYAAAVAALKPGGVLGVVQHRARQGTPSTTAGDIGYVDTAVIIAAAEKAGLVLEEQSEINANDKDTKDHPKGVWTLPPGFRLGDVDKAKYAAIGESDRMTIRFRKPAATSDETAPAAEAAEDATPE